MDNKKSFEDVVSLIESIGFKFIRDSINYDKAPMKTFQYNDYLFIYCHDNITLHDKNKTIEPYIINSKDFNIVYVKMKEYFKV